MKKTLYLLFLLIPALVQAQTISVTPQWRGLNPQVNTMDSLQYNYSGKLGGASWLYNAEKIRSIFTGYSKKDSLAAYGVDVSKFGLGRDSVVADSGLNSDAIDAAAAYAASNGIDKIVMPKGVYFIGRGIVLPKNVGFYGQGSMQTFIDGSQANSVNFPSFYTFYAEGTETQIDSLGATVAIGDTAITLSKNVTLKVGDVLRVYDTTDYSFSYKRPTYRNGEFFTVRQDVTNGTKVLIDHPSSARYGNIGAVKVFKADYTQANYVGFTVRCMPANTHHGIGMARAKNTKMEDVVSYGAGRLAIRYLFAYGFEIDRCWGNKFTAVSESPVTSYGIGIDASQNGKVDNCFAFGNRHGIALSGTMPNRYVVIQNSRFSSVSQYSIDMHGINQYITFDNNIAYNGAQLGGKDQIITNNRIFASNSNSYTEGNAINFDEPNGFNWLISGNIINAKWYDANGSKAIYMSFDSSNIDTAGTFKFHNNQVTYDVTDVPSAGAGVYYMVHMDYDDAFISTQQRGSFDFSNNTFIATGASREIRVGIVGIDKVNRNFKRAIWNNNTFENCSLYSLYVRDNIITNNKFLNTKWYAAQARGNNVQLLDNSFINYGMGSAVSAPAGFYSAFRLSSSTNVWVDGNVGSTTGTPTNGGYYNDITNLYRGANDIDKPESITSVTNNLGYMYPFLNSSSVVFTDINKRLTSAGTVPIANGGTGLTTLGTTLQMIRTNSGVTAYEWFTPLTLTATNTTLTFSQPYSPSVGSNSTVGINLANNNTWTGIITAGAAATRSFIIDRGAAAESGISFRESGVEQGALIKTASNNFALIGANSTQMQSWNRTSFVSTLLNAPNFTNTTAGTAGTDSLLVKDDATNNVRRIAANYYATLASPTFTGTPAAPTAAQGNNSTQLATTAYVDRPLVDNQLTKTANYTIVSGDFVAGKGATLDLYVDCTVGNVTITLPTYSSFAGYTIYVTKTDVSANTVTINTVVGNNTLVSQWQSRQFNSAPTIGWINH